jgi:hypothetical protein
MVDSSESTDINGLKTKAIKFGLMFWCLNVAVSWIPVCSTRVRYTVIVIRQRIRSLVKKLYCSSDFGCYILIMSM